MTWPFTHYGTGVLLGTAGFCLGLAGVLLHVGPVPALLPFALLAFVLWFFRDPDRTAAGDELDMVSPADGVVADVATLDDGDVGPRCVRIGVFLSVVDVHVNRVPCAGRVVAKSRRQGKCLDARDPRCVDENQAATIVLERDDGRRVGLRQITGLIARRIVCPVELGDTFARGERYGMIHFGSRTELIVTEDELADVLVSVGDRVKGGETLIARLRPTSDATPPAAEPAAATSPS